MEEQQIEAALNSVLERLAAIEHERWSHWQKYLHKSGLRQSDGSLIISSELIERWERQISTAYAELSEAEKDSDRDQVRKYLPVIKKALLTALAAQTTSS
ncbi:hypothetical protein A4U53_016135 [Rhizobium ruizarguesonis]|uniref:Uncharacterized protein n=2 Tax=Rhizobium TaxID=379 RepID=A0A179BIZ9_RHILE|nr:hypothetical protein [Rhizobium leguminosarum]OAP91255.1 hypothetical protein A4U53_27730 [Rhizobium leguminosarum]